jgi:hypothetical protein
MTLIGRRGDFFVSKGNPMNDADLEALVMKLRSTTALGRLAHGEAKAVVTVILALLAAPKA